MARVFGLHRNSVGRIAQQVEAEGAGAACAAQAGPRRRHKVTAQVMRVLREAVAAGWSTPVAQREVRRQAGVQLSHGHVWGLLQLKQEQPASLALDLPVASSTLSGNTVEGAAGELAPQPQPATAEPASDSTVQNSLALLRSSSDCERQRRSASSLL